jgi:hypothetical protein
MSKKKRLITVEVQEPVHMPPKLGSSKRLILKHMIYISVFRIVTLQAN